MTHKNAKSLAVINLYIKKSPARWRDFFYALKYLLRQIDVLKFFPLAKP